jgi:hypothetical protein
MKYMREIGQATATNRSTEVDYPLFMAVMMVLTSDRVEKRPRATPAVFPPPIFAGTASVSVFHVFPPPPDRDH